VPMSHHELEKEIEAFRKTSEGLVAMLKDGDLAGIDGLAQAHDASFRRLVECGPFTNPDDYQMMIDLKEAVGRTRKSPEESKERLFSRIIASRKKGQCMKDYEKKGFVG
jgi:hypothetical protein